MVSLDDPEGRIAQRTQYRIIAYIVGTVVAVGVFASGFFYIGGSGSVDRRHRVDPALLCRQPDAWEPTWDDGGLDSSEKFLKNSYIKHSAKLLGGAVQIPTVSYDDDALDPTQEPRFDIFAKLHEYLAESFPLTFKYAEKVNTYGLLFTIPGSNTTQKPVVLMAHQDVVPVNPEDLDDWTHDPFSGFYDGEWIWGRGSSDTKNSLIAILEAVEALLSQKAWKPQRTILLSFGFDEEIYGTRGARALANVIEDRYGHHGVEVIIDEGYGVQRNHEGLVASPAVAEKGRADYKVTINVPGGHSSVPPDHTGIGLASEMIYRLEQDAFIPPQAKKGAQAVVVGMFACLGRHIPGLDASTRELYLNLDHASYRQILLDILADNRMTRILVETTQAIDTIHGGVKVNALPEQVTFETNYRIEPDSSVKETTTRFLNHAKSIAADFDLSVYLDNEPVFGDATQTYGNLTITTTGLLDPAPVSPFYNDDVWSTLGGVSRHVFRDVVKHGDVVVAPGLMTGNTDTAHYWNLSTHIYRYTGVLMEDAEGIHTVNERLRFRSHISSVVWFYEFIVASTNQ